MRPGRNAPDNPDTVDTRRCEFPVASMRPGRNAPDNGFAPPPYHCAIAASMRPGRNAPDNEDAATELLELAELQ